MVSNPGSMRKSARVTIRSRVAHEPPSLAAMLFLAAALFALVLPIVGPVDDHHFAERAHNHDHIYLNGAPVSHDHAYDIADQHGHPGRPTRSYPKDLGWWRGDILNLTPATSALMLASLNAPYHQAPDTLRAPLTGHQANPLEPFTPAQLPGRSADLTPPLPPPVA